MLGLGPQEIFFILVFALIIFGPQKLPEIAKSVGKGLNAFKKATNSITDEIKQATTLEDEPEDTPKTKKA